MALSNIHAGQIAGIINTGFTEYRVQFEHISSGAKRRFEKALWQDVQASGMQRIDLYGQMVALVNTQLDEFRLAQKIKPEKASDWELVKAQFELLMPQRTDPELAETFFNSIFCRAFRHSSLREQRMFLFSSSAAAPKELAQDMYKEYNTSKGVVGMVSDILDDYAFDVPYANKRLDVINLVGIIKENTDFRMAMTDQTRVQILKSVF